MNLDKLLDRTLADQVENMRKISGHHPLKEYLEYVVRKSKWNSADIEEYWTYFAPNKRLKSTSLKVNKEAMTIEYNPYNIDQLLDQAKNVGQMNLQLYEFIWKTLWSFKQQKNIK